MDDAQDRELTRAAQQAVVAEVWHEDGCMICVDGIDPSDPQDSVVGRAFPVSGPHGDWHQSARARLAAAAPALVRALLAIEFHKRRPGNLDGETCHHCFRARGHGIDCPVDAALTAAGLADLSSRDAARAAIANPVRTVECEIVRNPDGSPLMFTRGKPSDG